MNSTIAFQDSFRPEILPVIGCKDYQIEKQLLERIDRILISSGVEDLFLQESLNAYQERKKKKESSEGWRHLFLSNSRQALRCSVLKHFCQMSFRTMSKQLAMSSLYQWFCHCENFDAVRAPSKSRLQEYFNWLPLDRMKKVLGNLTEMLADEEKAKEIGLENALDLEMVWVDSTCLKANIHFPVDWVLLKDASRSLIQSIVVIRKHGLMHRILDPKVYKKN